MQFAVPHILKKKYILLVPAYRFPILCETDNETLTIDKACNFFVI
jgi:hypothetical protein